MRLTQLVEIHEDNVVASRLARKVQELKQARKDLMLRAGSLGAQSGVKPEYADRVRQLDAQIRIAGEELTRAMAEPAISADLNKANQDAAIARAAVTPQERREGLGRSISQGFDKWKELRAELGGDEGIEAAIHQAALKQTEEGHYHLDVEQLAKEFGVPARSMYKWLERPSMIKTARMLPTQRK